jgi:hypothetical protein
MPDARWINEDAGAPAYDAGELRRTEAVHLAPKGASGVTPFGAVQGVRPGFTSGLVTLAGSTITVKAHGGVLSPDLSITQGPYVYQLNADETHTLTAAHATLVRDDLVYVQVSDDDEDGSGDREVVSGYLAGTPGAGLPSLPARSVELARINVPASGGGSAVLTERQLYTAAAGGVLPVRDSGDYPAHYEGRVIYDLTLNKLLISDGSAWQTVAQLGAPTAFTITTAGSSGITIGTAVQRNRWMLVAPKLAWFCIDLTFNPTTNITGVVVLGPLPFTVAPGSGATNQTAPATLSDDSAATGHAGGCLLKDTQVFRIRTDGGNVTATHPFTWDTDDRILIQGVVEIV